MVLLDCGERRLLGDLYFLELTRGLEQALEARGLGPVILATRDTLREWVRSRGIDGVILPTSAERRILAREFAADGMPCVIIDQSPPEDIPGVGWVLLDLEPGAREAARVLVSRGHRRIGFIGNAEDDEVRIAFYDEMAKAGHPMAAELSIMAGAGRPKGAAAMRRLLNMSSRPTAVFARTDLLALGALEAAVDLNVRVPEDMSIIGHDDISLAGSTDLTTVRIDCGALGQGAADVLTALRASGTGVPPAVPVVSTTLVVRHTLGPAPRASA
jgi:LacI family transcriptional regulator